MNRFLPRLFLATLLLAVISLKPASAAPADAAPSELDSLTEKLQRATAAATEADILRLLQLGRDSGRPFQVAPIVKNYLAQNVQPAPAVLLAAAENAWLTADYRTALTRYKAYLKQAQPSAEASAVAARLYAIQIDFLGDKEDAYRFMSDNGANLRQTVAARRFDSWFLGEARQRRDLPALAKHLAAALADKLPIEQERLLFWDDIEWLLDMLVQTEDPAPALAATRTVVERLRESQPWSLKYRLYIAYLDYKLARAGKTEEAAEPLFAPVVAAARAYFDAYPTAATLQNICSIWAGGVGQTLSSPEWTKQLRAKREFFLTAFAKLKDPDQTAMLRWQPAGRTAQPQLATPAQWSALLVKFPSVFANADNLAQVPLLAATSDAALLKQQAQILKNQPVRAAAVINSLAASDDFAGVLQAYVRQQSWHLSATEFTSIVQTELWPAYKTLHAADKTRTADEVYHKAWATVGTEAVLNTPVAFYDANAVREFLVAYWRYAPGDGQDKTAVVQLLNSLGWLPWTERHHRSALEHLHRQIQDWSKSVRRSKEPKIKALESQIAPLETAVRALSSLTALDPSQAPTPLQRQLAAAYLATQRRDGPAHLKAAREAYPALREFDTRKIPFAESALWIILRAPASSKELGQFHAEVLADQMGRNQGSLRLLIRPLAHSYHPNGEWHQIPANQQPEIGLINAALRKHLLALVDQNQFDGELFNLFRATRQGSRWNDYQSGGDLLEKMIAKKTLLNTDYRPNPAIRSAAVSYQALVRNEFPTVNAKFPFESAFDDLFVEEAQKTGYLDGAYWQFGRDSQRKVANLAAKLLQQHPTAPFGWTDAPALYSPEAFWDWHNRALNAEPALRDALLAKLDGWQGKTRFDGYALGAGWFSSKIETATRPEFFAKLAESTQRLQATPARHSFLRFGSLSRLVPKPESLTDAELATLLTVVTELAPAQWFGRAGFEDLVQVLVQGLLAKQRQGDVLAVVPQAWRVALNTTNANLHRFLTQVADAQLKAQQHEVSSALCAAGLELLGAELPNDVRTALVALRSQSLLNIGGTIPVDRQDPRYPVYAAQAAYNAGNFQNAWVLVSPHAERVLGMLKELDPRFCIWLINENAKNQQFDNAENLARQLLPWIESAGGTVDAETRARLLMAYANIAFERREYPKARALFERIVTADEFEGTLAKEESELRIAESDRLSKQHDKAFELLDKLTRRKNRNIQTEAFHQLARLKFDQEDYQEARQFLNQVFMRVPDHAEARILEGNLDLKMKRLIEATEVKVGLTTSQRILVPGRPLKVRIEDQNLATVGKADSIELRTWTDSGDEEFFNLVPFGDSKTKFEGAIGTILAPTTKGDKTLQVLGQDVVHYDFSPRFKKLHNITSEPFSLKVVTDSELYAASGRILSREEIAERQMEQLLREKLQMEREQQERIALSLVRPADQIKPGNKINIRVVDPDRSKTAGKDSLLVKVQASSGDVVSQFALTETDTHSGVFEAALPTASAQATAVASNSEEGKQPSFPISAGNHPAWVALPDNVRPKLYTIDLNDNVPLGKLTLRSDIDGHRLKKFSLQTSLNGRQFTTLASWPQTHQPWGGELTLTIAKLDPKTSLPTVDAHRDYLQYGVLEKGFTPFQSQPKSLAIDLPAHLAGKIGAAEPYVAHLRGAFYLDNRQSRTLRFQTKPDPRTRYLFFVDGEAVTAGGTAAEPVPPEIKKSFAKGVHLIDVYVVSTPQAGAQVQVLWDIEQAPYMAVCPIESFDPTKHPQIRETVLVAPAQVNADAKNENFEFSFAPESRARVLRFVLEDFESDSPAIARISLSNTAGKQILPTQQDLTKLKDNQTLEIIPGDKITVTYEDPQVVTAGRNVHQASLSATYLNATINACFVEYTQAADGERKGSYVPVRRFSAGDTIAVVINDPDMDTTAQADKVQFTAQTTGGKPVLVDALETEDHSGVFIGKIFPVKNTPQRATELQITTGDDITVTYLDPENTNPGVPWARTDSIEQAVYVTPQLRLYNVASEPITATNAQAAAARQTGTATEPIDGDEFFPATRTLLASRPKQPAGDQPSQALLDGPVFVEVLFPTIALSQRSTATLYVQTAAGRAKHGQPLAEPFDTTVPGTIRLVTGPSDVGRGGLPPGYAGLTVKGDPEAISPIDDGRFAFNLPIKLGEPPAQSLVAAEGEVKTTEKPVLLVKGGDEIFVGYQFKDAQGQTQWLTGRVVLGSDVFLDVMDRKYREELSGAHVGENLYFRVVDKSKHLTADKDLIRLELRTSSGQVKPLQLLETFGDTGVFKGYVTLAHAQDQLDTNNPVLLPVQYGDQITVAYQAHPEASPLSRTLTVYKGADGSVLPFTKRFKDPEIAVQTQFTIAESWFELAKKHRELGEESLARREIGQGKKVLEEVLRDYPDTKAQAQADYLLANLALEFANMAVDATAKRKHYMEAVGRFTDLVASFGESPYAPKAQFKKALTYEKMGEIDQACEEYVKLSYRYPDNELVAETIARLGQYFFTKAKLILDRIAAEKDPLAQEKLKLESRAMFTTAAEVFGRLAVRFPGHSLAAKSTVLSAQCYMRAEDYATAIRTFRNVTEDANAEKEARAEGMYWCADAYLKLAKTPTGKAVSTADPVVEAFRLFKRLVWDYPESKWAKFARGRLTEPALAGAARSDQ